MLSVAENRKTFLWGAGEIPEILIVGYDLSPTEFYIEGIVALPGASPRRLLRAAQAGLQVARERGYKVLTLSLDDRHPDVHGLAVLAARLKFEPFDCDDTRVHYRKEIA